MPARYRVDRSQGVVSSPLEGTVDDDDMLGHQEGLAADPDFEPGFSQLVDATGMVYLPISLETLRAVA